MHEKQYLARHGTACVINRDTPVSAKVSFNQSSRGANFGLRESAWEGWIDPGPVPGETFTVGSDSYIVCAARGEGDATGFTALKTNSLITAIDFTMGEDEYGNPILAWTLIEADLAVYGLIASASLIQTNPGLLPTTKRLYTIPATVSLKLLDRIVHQCTQQQAIDMGAVWDPVYLGARLQVDHIDEILLPGLKQVQVSYDTRPDE